MSASLPTPLDVAASIDRVLRRNIQWPLRNVVFADSPVSLSVLNRSLMADATLGAIAVSLPDATLVQGMFFEIKKTDATVNTVTIMSSVGGQTIDGAASNILSAANAFVKVESDGANYKIVSSSSASAVSATPKAATYVVHPTVGLGDFTTIEAALAAVPAQGAYILAREFTFNPPAGGYITPNAPVVLRGCGPGTIIDLLAAADAAFNVGFAQAFTLEDIRVTGNVANVNRRVVSASAAATIKLNRVTGENLRQISEVTGGVAATISKSKCTFALFNDPASWFVNANPATTVSAEDVQVLGASDAGGISGGPLVKLDRCVISAVNGLSFADDSVLEGTTFRGVAGEAAAVGSRVKATACRFVALLMNVTGDSVEFSACEFPGSAGQARCMDVTASIAGPQVIGCTFSGCITDHIRTASIDTIIKGCQFFDNGSLVRGVDVLAFAFRTLISGNNFQFMDEAVRTASANGIYTNNIGCKVVEVGSANQNRYGNNTGFDPSTIIGAASIIEDSNVLSAVGIDITLDAFMRTVPVNAAGGNRIITLPTAASAKWRKYTIKKVDSSANTVTVDASGAETIDGALTQVLTSQWQTLEIQSDGTAWYRVSEGVASVGLDPRDVFRFSMIHNVGVTGGG